jgi:hypothetical protein
VFGLEPRLPAVPAAGRTTYRLSDEAWRAIEEACGENRTLVWGEYAGPEGEWVERRVGTSADLRAGIEDAIGYYLGWSPDGRRPVRLNRKRLVARGERIAAAARELRAALAEADNEIAAAERDYLATRMEQTGSGSLVAWESIDRILPAVEDAGVGCGGGTPAVTVGTPQ